MPDKYITAYQEIRYPLKRQARDFARRRALDTLSLFSQKATLRVPHIQFLYFHHVFNDEQAGMRSMLSMLADNYRFISYSEAVNRLHTGNIDAPYVCFSSDDGFRNNLVSAEIFKEFGASCCYFICPSVIGLSDHRQVAAFCRTKLHLPAVEFLNWDDVASLQRQGHEIGNHTNTHERLSKLDTQQQEEEIGKARETLSHRCGQHEHFAFPYGTFGDITDETLQLVRKQGYLSCASAVRGAYLPGSMKPKADLLRRDQVFFRESGRHLNYFIAKNIKAAQRGQ